jgi:SAM-dependent methyltransferase
MCWFITRSVMTTIKTMLPSPLDRWHDPALIDHLARVRKPWETLTRRIVQATLAKFLPASPGPVVEIGAGGGQLREWLPNELAAHVTHTEPSEPLLAVLREKYPDARAIQAEADALPFESGSVGAVLALCVFDTLPNLAAVRDELKRVLRPGGVVIHLLDLSTSPDCLFPELIARGEIPLTNFARDSALLEVLTDAQRALLPPVDDFDEVIAVKWDAFRAFVGMLEQARHPLAANLGPYSGLHEPERRSAEKVAQGFMTASADPTRLLALNRALLTLTLSARQMGREWPLRAISTRAHIRERLKTAFSPEHGFRVEFAGPVAARELIPRDGSFTAETQFVLRHAGRTVTRTELPVTEFGTQVSTWDGLPMPPQTAAGSEIIHETTVEICTAVHV